jgi:hypothetical protein
MYLTEKSRGKQRPEDQHDEVELLLEAYVKQVDGIVQEADQLASNMRNTEEIVNIILDANRNSLMLLDLKVPPNTAPSCSLTLLLFHGSFNSGVNDDFGYWFRCRDRRSPRHEPQKLHGRLAIWIPGNHVPRVRNKYACLRIWSHTTQTDTKVDFIRTVSWCWE